MKEEILVLESAVIQKQNFMAYSELYLQVCKGEINGIIFDNILERQYLLEFFRGELLLDSGRIYMNEKLISALNASRELKKIVRIIEMKSKLIPSMSLAENIFLFADQTFFVTKKQYQAAFGELKERFEVLENVENRTKDLSAKDRVIVELLKAYVEHKTIVVLDNPTAFLKEVEIEEICRLLEKLREKMAIIITIGFEDAGVKWMEKVFVIQKGKTIAVMRPVEDNINKIFQALLSERKPIEILKSSVKWNKVGKTETVIEFQNVSTSYLKNLNFKIEPGEILKICYLDEKSCSHIRMLLSGDMELSEGAIYLNEKMYRVKNVYEAIKKGVCFIEERPYQSMLFSNMSIIENLSIPLHEKVNWFWQLRKYSKSVESFAQNFMENNAFKKKLKYQKGTTLQQIAYSKWLLYAPSVIVCLNPFADIDIYMRETTIEMLHDFQDSGISVIILTSNLHTLQKIEGDTIYIHQGIIINEDEMYQELYKE